MPELPEVESARRLLEAALGGRRLQGVEAADDAIVAQGLSPEAVSAAVEGRVVQRVARKGKFLWLQMDEVSLGIHLGMSGAVLDCTPGSDRSVHYHRIKSTAEPGARPRFLKLWLPSDQGTAAAFVDGRRLGRIWLAGRPQEDPKWLALGPDAHTELPDPAELHRLLSRRSAPIKAALLDQSLLAGIGNYLADEILFAAGIAPARPARSLSLEEAALLHDATASIIRHAVEVDADDSRYPEDWLFHIRWGGKMGDHEVNGLILRRETIGGRTTAWVPARQK